ncbi:MAG: DUF4382 domain-containing protein [Candidatus Nanohaloarchaea archaeon]|nr:DUF4382 domain-containing protein [Candidatus Nanohaloarchaea archaeon]
MRKTTLALALLTVIALAGCTGANTGGTGDSGPGQSVQQGTFTLYVSDQPVNISRFDSLEVTLSEARVFQQVNNTTTPKTLPLNSTIDITQLVGAKAAKVITTKLQAGTYTKIELYAAEIGGVVDGQQVQVKLPSGKLMLNKEFQIQPNSTVEFVFDIHVVRRGRGNGYLLRPVIAKSGVVGQDVEQPETIPAAGGKGNKPDTLPNNTDGGNGSQSSAKPVEVVSASPDTTVTMKSIEFQRSPTVKPGTVIRFINQDSVPHTVTIKKYGIDRTVAGGESVTLRFNQPATYEVDCTLHGPMKTSVTVEG